MPKERLQKVLAAAGLASRRECEQIILDGRVSVNARKVHSLPVLVDPDVDKIAVDGRPLRAQRKVYFLLHKPKGVHCTNYDPDGRPRAVDLLGGVRERVFPVGRLDADTTGLLLMTNDGELAQRLTHPRHGIPKTYRAHVNGLITREQLDELRKGVWLAEGKTRVSEATVIHAARDQSVVEITLREGRNREVRRVLAKIGHAVRKLIRIRIGPLSLRGLGPGEFRPLTSSEVNLLKNYKPHPERRAKTTPADTGNHQMTPRKHHGRTGHRGLQRKIPRRRSRD
ncbi:MAG TPA: pseudouridine synthase [Phycisphaerae bacterium]|nr:pseudouridine synthase [Phycisphaerae bacterium]HRR85884.1 pseudouridine synthase [Phycisphaerae bacterium]